MHIMFCSATPMSKKRSGKRSAKKLVMVDSTRSPTSTTTLGFFSPSSTSAWPKPSRVFRVSTFRMAFSSCSGDMGSFAAALRPGSSVREQPRRPFGVRRSQLLQRDFRLLHLGRHPVPAVVVLHVAHALAHHRAEENDRRLAAGPARLRKRLQDRRHVVPVGVDHVPVEGPVFVR